MATVVLPVQSVAQNASTLSYPGSTARERFTVSFSAQNAVLTADNAGTQKSRIVISRTAVDSVTLQPTGRTSVLNLEMKDSIVNPHELMGGMLLVLRGVLADTVLIEQLMSGVVPTTTTTIYTP